MTDCKGRDFDRIAPPVNPPLPPRPGSVGLGRITQLTEREPDMFERDMMARDAELASLRAKVEAVEAERDTALAEVHALKGRVRAAEASVEDLAAADVEAAHAERNLSQSELDAIAEVLGLPVNGSHNAVLDKVRELIAPKAEPKPAAKPRPRAGRKKP